MKVSKEVHSFLDSPDVDFKPVVSPAFNNEVEEFKERASLVRSALDKVMEAVVVGIFYIVMMRLIERIPRTQC